MRFLVLVVAHQSKPNLLFKGKFNDRHLDYRIVASTNTCYYSDNQLFVKRSQYIRTENPLHKQSEKAKTCH